MSKEAELIHQLATVRKALENEREALMARVAAIDEALGLRGAKAAPRPKKTGNIKDDVLRILGTAPQTMKGIQGAIPDASPNSVQSVVYGLVGSGELAKDDSNPKKFSIAEKPKTNGVKRAAT